MNAHCVHPGVDAESTLALRYDLGVAQESANDLDAALKSFSQVYAVNIDYRDVARPHRRSSENHALIAAFPGNHRHS